MDWIARKIYFPYACMPRSGMWPQAMFSVDLASEKRWWCEQLLAKLRRCKWTYNDKYYGELVAMTTIILNKQKMHQLLKEKNIHFHFHFRMFTDLMEFESIQPGAFSKLACLRSMYVRFYGANHTLYSMHVCTNNATLYLVFECTIDLMCAHNDNKQKKNSQSKEIL